MECCKAVGVKPWIVADEVQSEYQNSLNIGSGKLFGSLRFGSQRGAAECAKCVLPWPGLNGGSGVVMRSSNNLNGESLNGPYHLAVYGRKLREGDPVSRND